MHTSKFPDLFLERLYIWLWLEGNLCEGERFGDEWARDRGKRFYRGEEATHIIYRSTLIKFSFLHYLSLHICPHLCISYGCYKIPVKFWLIWIYDMKHWNPPTIFDPYIFLRKFKYIYITYILYCNVNTKFLIVCTERCLKNIREKEKERKTKKNMYV